MLPLVKNIKDGTKPLPKPSNNIQATSTTPTYNSFDNTYDEPARDRDTLRSRSTVDHESVTINREPTPQPLGTQPPGSFNLSRKYSTKKIDIAPTKSYISKSSVSPTGPARGGDIREQYATINESGINSIASTLVNTPSTAVHSPPTTREHNIISTLPTPASPHGASGSLGRSMSTTRPRGYKTRDEPDPQRERARELERAEREKRRAERSTLAQSSTVSSPPADDDDGPNPPTVEIFKSFRVSMDDPCYKVLPAALKRYNIQADWQHYALYIVYGDQERCLGYDEKPLILFKQLDKEGKKPMFMLRRHINPETGQPGGVVNANPPGGVL